VVWCLSETGFGDFGGEFDNQLQISSWV
jgi:hypothetical protein